MVEVKNSELEQFITPPEIGELPETKIPNELPSAKLLELEDLEDLLLMTVSQNNPDPHLYHIECNGKHMYLVWIIIHDYYQLNGLPLVIFVRTDNEPNRFIKYRPDSGKIEFTKRIEESSAAYVKIIKIKQLPFCLDVAF